jgi:hypothetical protein
MSMPTAQATRMATPGTISPKTILAAVLPTLGGIIAVGIQWGVTGEFDRAELATALTAAGTALVAGLGAYLGAPGEVAVSDPLGVPADTTGATPVL